MSAQSSVLKWFACTVATPEESDWEELYHEQLPKIYNFFRYRVGDGPVAEDLTSLTFERAWRARGRYRRDPAGFSTWLFTIARNVAIDHFRQRHEFRPLDELDQLPAPQTLEEAVQQDDDFQRLAALLSNLPDREREVLSLKYAAGLTNRAISSLTGLTESNVGTILHRTIQTLRMLWNDGG